MQDAPHTFFLVDLENIPIPNVSSFNHKGYKIVIFVGAAISQNKQAANLVERLTSIGVTPEQIECIKVRHTGPNSLDFHLVRHIGHLETANPQAAFVIVSKDLDYKPVMLSMINEGKEIGYSNSILPIGFIPVKSDPLCDIASKVAFNLEKTPCKPRKFQKLLNYVASHFKLNEDQANAIAKILLSIGYIQLIKTNAATKNKAINYHPLPCPFPTTISLH